jgi:ketosteroid isomerase-like protein
MRARSAETDTSRQLVVDYFQARRAADAATLARVLADDVEWAPPQSAPLEGRPFVGRDAVIAAMHREGARFFDLETGRGDLRKLVADGDMVVVLYDFACTARNGREYSNTYILVFTCTDAQIVRIDEHTDTLRFARIAMEP